MLWVADGSRAASPRRPAEEFSSTSSSMASATVHRSSALLQKPTCVEPGNASKQSNTRSAWVHSPSKKSSPTTVSCAAWAARRAQDCVGTSSMLTLRTARHDCDETIWRRQRSGRIGKCSIAFGAPISALLFSHRMRPSSESRPTEGGSLLYARRRKAHRGHSSRLG